MYGICNQVSGSSLFYQAISWLCVKKLLLEFAVVKGWKVIYFKYGDHRLIIAMNLNFR
jgi:hypothetical protein